MPFQIQIIFLYIFALSLVDLVDEHRLFFRYRTRASRSLTVVQRLGRGGRRVWQCLTDAWIRKSHLHLRISRPPPSLIIFNFPCWVLYKVSSLITSSRASSSSLSNSSSNSKGLRTPFHRRLPRMARIIRFQVYCTFCRQNGGDMSVTVTSGRLKEQKCGQELLC